ncbi:MAG: pilin [Candidatus Sungiibacteriota bacterium]
MMTTALFNLIPVARAQVGLDFLNLPPGAQIGDVLARLYVYGVGVVAISAMIMLVIGGVQYMVAGDKDPSSAKERIKNAIWGLILALTSYLILYTINPDLTKKVILTPIKIDVVDPPTTTNLPEGSPCTGASTCAAGFCIEDQQSCSRALGIRSGICRVSCTPSGGPGGTPCTSSAECASGSFCKVTSPSCRSALNGEPGQCLTANCRLP